VLALGCVLPLVPADAQAAHVPRSMTFRYGPVTVPPYTAVRNGVPVRAPRVNGYVTAMSVRVVDAGGRAIPVSQVMPHHVIFANLGFGGHPRQDAACPGDAGGQRFYGTSEELRAMRLPRGYGYKIRDRDRWRMGWMLMNHTHRIRRAWLEYRIRIAARGGRTKPVTPYWWSVLGCGVDPQFTVPGDGPEGSVYTRSSVYRMPASGRIVAVGGHLHGGAQGLELQQPRCGDRTLVASDPTYGLEDDPVYQVAPPLHEPDPLDMSWWSSAAGIPVRKGEPLRVVARYRGDFPFMRVMGIDHVYVARGRAPSGCPSLPEDATVLRARWPGRTEPPHTPLTLAALGRDGRAHPVDDLAGVERAFATDGAASERDWSFGPAKLSIPAGARVTWSFQDRDLHDVTLADGPRGFGSPPIRGGGSFTQRFDVPGTYRLFCSVHPVRMRQILTVR
jgi:plastocyanin